MIRLSQLYSWDSTRQENEVIDNQKIEWKQLVRKLMEKV